MRGTLVTGEQAAAAFVAATEATLADAVGFRPFHGTLNLSAVDGLADLPERHLDEDLGDPRCRGVRFRPCAVGGVRSAVIRPLVPDYPEDKVELVAPVRLRGLFGLDDGAPVPLSPPDDRWAPDGPAAALDALDGFDAAVFDLDGTLVDLAVDWPSVHDELETIVGPHLDRPLTEHGRNELFEVAEAHEVYDDLVDTIAAREREGAAVADPLPGVHDLGDLGCPVGICTANAGTAAEVALERFGAAGAVDAVVARETTREGKPHPRPLLACLERLGVAPGDAVFVGNEPSDAEAAARAGTSFLHVEQLWPGG